MSEIEDIRWALYFIEESIALGEENKRLKNLQYAMKSIKRAIEKLPQFDMNKIFNK